MTNATGRDSVIPVEFPAAGGHVPDAKNDMGSIMGPWSAENANANAQPKSGERHWEQTIGFVHPVPLCALSRSC